MPRNLLLAMVALFAVSHAAWATVLTGPIVNPANDHNYYLLDAEQWVDAEAEAVTLGGHLATINDAAENAWVTGQFSSFGGAKQLWIGLNDVAVEGTFVWTSGEAVTYTNWNAGEPNNSNGGEDYAAIFAPDATAYPKWNDINVSNSTYGVVEVVPEPSTMALAGLGFAGLIVWAARRRRAAMR